MAVRRPRGDARRRSLTGRQMNELYGYLEALLKREGCDNTHRFTREFLESSGLAVEPELAWMRHMGGWCDCEVYVNVAWADWD